MPLGPPESMQTSEPAPAPRSRWLRRVLLGGGLAVLVLALGIGGLVWQVTRSSLSLDLFDSRIEAAIRASLPAASEVSIGTTAVSYRSDTGLVLTARNVRVVLPKQGILSAGELSTETTPGAVLRGRVMIRSIAATNVDIAVRLGPFPVPTGSAADMLRHGAERLVAELIQTDDAMRSAGLEEVVVRNVGLRLLAADSSFGPPLTLTEANWRPLGPGRSKAWLQIAEERTTGWDLTVERQRGRLGGTTVIMKVEDLPVGALLPELANGEAEGKPYYEALVSLQARVRVDRDAGFSDLRGSLTTGSGRLSISGKDRIEIAGSTLSFALGPSGDRVVLPTGELRTQTGRVAFEGVADLSRPGSVTLLARLREGQLPTGTAGDHVRLTGGGLLARVSFADLALNVERLHLTTAEGTLSAIGQASLGGSTPGLSFALSMTEMPVRVARALWPPFIADKTRRWFDVNVRSGTLGPATLQVALPPDFIGPRGRDRILPAYALIGDMPFKDAEFSPLPTLPVIRQAAGHIAFANATATVQATSGVVVVDGAGELQAAGTSLAIPELGRPQPRGELHLALAGPAAALARLSDMPPLAVAAERGIAAEALSGNAELSLDVSIPLFETTLDVEPSFRLALTDFTSTRPIEERLIADADLVLEGSPHSFTVKGSGTLDGIEASVDLILGSSAASQTEVTLTLDEAARERLGLDFGGLIDGPVQASLASDPKGQTVALDLKEARIALPFLGWEKGPGVPATAHFRLERDESGTRVSDLLLSGKGFSAKGSLAIGSDGRLTGIELSQLALRPGDDLSASVKADGEGYAVTVRGGSLDARGIIRSLKSGLSGSDASSARIRVTLDLDEVRGENEVVLTGVSGRLVINKAGLDAGSLEGRANGSEGFELTIEKEGDTRVLRLFADNGGALLRFTGVYDKIAGGNLILDYSGPVGGTGSGVVLLRDFRLIGERALAPALETVTQAAREAAAERASMAASGDLSFSQLRIPFRQKDWVIVIDDAALRGATLGATASGTVNVPDRKIAIAGTFIPAFGLNNIAGSIPLLGAILGGGRDEGLVGITYKLFGPLDAPQLSFNPISAIAPGIFRKIFEYN
jgi:hypothetical protein